eukprot:12101543-Prorocentrum_lima.AAC.1
MGGSASTRDAFNDTLVVKSCASNQQLPKVLGVLGGQPLVLLECSSRRKATIKSDEPCLDVPEVAVDPL